MTSKDEEIAQLEALMVDQAEIIVAVVDPSPQIQVDLDGRAPSLELSWDPEQDVIWVEINGRPAMFEGVASEFFEAIFTMIQLKQELDVDSSATLNTEEGTP